MATDDLNDSLDELFGGGVAKAPLARITDDLKQQRQDLGVIAPADRTYFEPCTKCNGTGMTRWGTCFRCKGEKGRTLKTSPEQRAKARERTAVKAANRQLENAAWREQHKAELAWLNTAADRQLQLSHRPGHKTWGFPIELQNSLGQYGTLTDGQIGAIRKCMARDAERIAQRAADRATAPTVDISKIEAAFARAKGAAYDDGEGIKWLKLRLDTFVFSDAPARGQWPAAVFIKEGITKWGRITGGRLILSPDCPAETRERILACLADPAAAAKAYGLRTSTCSCCGRELTNRESIDLGIGPICAERFFGG